jgi:CHAD domain-containing protein
MSEITKKADGPLTEERVHVLRKQMKGRRYCMDEETEIIFLATLEDVRNIIIVLLKIIPWMNG